MNDAYTQMMITGVIEIVFGIAVIALAGWLLWKRVIKNKRDSKPSVGEEENKEQG